MASFTITPMEKGNMRCRHSGSFSHEDVRSLGDFFYDYRGKLLIDLQGTSGEECARNMRTFRPMMPTAAIFGAKIDPAALEIPESYYAKEVRWFATEQEALVWLREQ